MMTKSEIMGMIATEVAEANNPKPTLPPIDPFETWPRTPDGRLICSPEHPFPIGCGEAYGPRWAHTNCGEVGEQEDGYPSGDTVTMKCADCGYHWTAELPQ
jgi:hypothetical protein